MIFCNEPRKSEEEKGYLKKIWRGMRNPATYSTPLYMNYYYEIISLALSFTLRASPFFLGRVALAASSDVTAPLSQTNQLVSNMAFVSMVVFLWCVLHSRYAQHRVVWGWGGGGVKEVFWTLQLFEVCCGGNPSRGVWGGYLRNHLRLRAPVSGY